MRAILIDPEKWIINEFEFEGDYKVIQSTIGCRRFTTGSRPLRGDMEQGFDTLYVSDDYLEDRDPRFWFQVDADRDPPSSHPLAGPGLVLGVDKDGKECAAQISVAELASRITFTRRKFRGFELHRGRGVGTLAGLRVNEFVRIAIKAPIIDGADEGR